MSADGIKVLLVEDDEDDFILTKDLLSQAPGAKFQLDWISDYDRGLKAISENKHDVYLLDYRLGEHTGLELLETATNNGCRAPMILLTGQTDLDVDMETLKAGGADYLVKGQADALSIERSIRYAIERKRSEAALRESEKRYRLLFNNTNEAIFVYPAPNSDGTFGNFIEVNDVACKWLGYSRSELQRMTPLEIQYPGTEIDFVSLIGTLYDEPHVVFETTFKNRNDDIIPVEIGVFLFHLNGRLTVQAIARNITERKEAESLSKGRAEFLSELVGLSDAADIGISAFKRIREMMPCDAGIMVITRGESEDKTHEIIYKFDTSESGEMIEQSERRQFTPVSDSALGKALLEKTRQVIHRDEKEHEKNSSVIGDLPDGVNRKSRSLIFMPLQSYGQTIGAFGVQSYLPDTYNEKRISILETLAADLTLAVAGALASEKLRASEEMLSRIASEYTAMIDTVPALMYLKDRDGKYRAVNKEFCKIIGVEAGDIINSDGSGCISEELKEIYFKDDPKVAEGFLHFINQEQMIRNSDNSNMWIATTKVPIYGHEDEVIGIVGLIHDITEQRRAREQLIQSDKLAGIGILAAGVAHEINNPIGYVSSNLNTMSKYLLKIKNYIEKAGQSEGSDSERFKFIIDDFSDAIQESMEGTTRVKDIVMDLKSFSRVDRKEKENANINDGLNSTLNIVWNELKYHCQVEKDLGDIPELYCIPNQLNQVFMNLLLNAGQAIKDKEGRIIVKTWVEDDNIYVSFKDNGCGIPEESLNKIFEPFFTTKDVGKGTGLGLSLVYDIIKKHKGKIDVVSEVGVGTEFIVALPLEGIDED